VLNDTARLVGHRLGRTERLDWHLLLALGSALLVIIAYLIPMFPTRITHATTQFTTTITELDFPTLIHNQHYTQAKPPLKEEFVSVAIQTAPVEGHNGSGLGWLLAAARAKPFTLYFVGFIVCLAWPALIALLAAIWVLSAWRSPNGLAERFIPILTGMALVAPAALWLAWQHQFDFSAQLLALQRQALAPAAGWWLALAGAAGLFVALFMLRRETQRPIFTWWALVFLVAVSVWMLVHFKPYPYLEIWLFIYDGILVTLRLVATSFGFILLVSLLGGLGRISRNKMIYGVASLYVELIRGIPLLVQLLFIWFALPQVFDLISKALLAASPSLAPQAKWFSELRLSPYAASVLGFTICYGAYGSEIFRAGISSIHRGQMEAARSLGMTYIQAMRYIVLPQAVRVILPPVGNEFVALLKDSSLVSVLAVSDLTRRGREYMARTFLSFDTWILVALCYLVLTLFSSRAVEFIESKTRFER